MQEIEGRSKFSDESERPVNGTKEEYQILRFTAQNQ